MPHVAAERGIIMIIYFSGTGNSRYCAQMLAKALNDDLLDTAGYIKHGIAAELISGKPWVFVGPTYAWQMAHIFSDFIRTGTFNGSDEAYFVLTCGGDIGNAGQPLSKLCEEKKFRYMGTLEVVMPENYVAMFPVPSEEKSAEIIAAAGPVLKQAAACIAQRAPFPARKLSVVDKLKTGPVNQGFYKFYVKADDFFVTDKCISCGKCVDSCVLNNIQLMDGKPGWGPSCTHCMACICGCPTEAIEYGKRSQGKRRYLCPEFK